jgi:hypothetical protein
MHDVDELPVLANEMEVEALQELLGGTFKTVSSELKNSLSYLGTQMKINYSIARDDLSYFIWHNFGGYEGPAKLSPGTV